VKTATVKEYCHFNEIAHITKSCEVMKLFKKKKTMYCARYEIQYIEKIEFAKTQPLHTKTDVSFNIFLQTKKRTKRAPFTGDEVSFAPMICKCNFIWPSAKIKNNVFLSLSLSISFIIKLPKFFNPYLFTYY